MIGRISWSTGRARLDKIYKTSSHKWWRRRPDDLAGWAHLLYRRCWLKTINIKILLCAKELGCWTGSKSVNQWAWAQVHTVWTSNKVKSILLSFHGRNRITSSFNRGITTFNNSKYSLSLYWKYSVLYELVCFHRPVQTCSPSSSLTFISLSSSHSPSFIPPFLTS